MQVLCISGVDGAGKTTQIDALEEYFRRVRNFSVYRLWLRWFSFTSYLLFAYAKLVKRTVTIRARSRTFRIHIFWVDKALQVLYPRLLLFDLALWYLLNKFRARVLGFKLMLLDRYFLDAFVDLIWEIRSVKFLHSLIGRVLLGLSRTIQTAVLVVEPVEVARRKNDIVSLVEISFKKRCYELFADYMELPIIDTTRQNPQETFRILVRFLEGS